ncbi:hypothetical protein QFC19_001115 [Naganishia cerealis]|uniref:Uncharacterized protein n=1 Tax=Naganishia cerealis TaxID=610337 RepID=A0ACC2WLB0_9TREE|nr:hypothetical protein QFC19_001115 [Naganishia cerealis]
MTISTAAPDYLLHNADLPTPGVRKDYHRFYLDPHTLPSPRIVGVLACQRDPYLRSLETRVVAVQKAGEEALARSRGVTAQMANAQPGKEKEKGKGGKGKGGKGNSDKAVSNGNKDKDEPELWQVEIEDTVLFPEGKFFSPLSTSYGGIVPYMLILLHIPHGQAEGSQTTRVYFTSLQMAGSPSHSSSRMSFDAG